MNSITPCVPTARGGVLGLKLLVVAALAGLGGLGLPASQALAASIYAVDLTEPHPNIPGARRPIAQFSNNRLRSFVASFQGVVNRGAPRLFVIMSDSDRYWLQQMETDYGFTVTEFSQDAGNLWDVFNVPDLKSRCSRVVVYQNGYDSAGVQLRPGSLENLALTMASAASDGTAVLKLQTEDLDGDGTSDGETDRLAVLAAGFTIVGDIRNQFPTPAAGQLDTAVNQYLYDNYRNHPAINTAMLGISPGDHRGRNWSIDYQVQQRLLVWGLDAEEHTIGNYATTQRDLLSAFGKRKLAIGTWFEENPDVAALSAYGHYQVGDGRNHSVYTQLEPAVVPDQVQGAAALPAYDPNKKYVLFSFTQGDATEFCQSWNLDHLLAMSSVDPTKRVAQRYPFGLMQTTLSLNLQPNVVKHLYALKTNKQFFTGKPLGYTDPTVMDQKGYLNDWLESSKAKLTQHGYPDIMINDRGAEGDPDRVILHKISIALKPRGIIFKHAFDTTQTDDDDPRYVDGVPVFPDPVKSIPLSAADEDLDVPRTYDAVVNSAYTHGRQFFWVFLEHTISAHRLEQLLEMLKTNHPDIVPVSTDQFVRLYRQAYPPPTVTTFTSTAAEDGYVLESGAGTGVGGSASSSGATSEALRIGDNAGNRQYKTILSFDTSALPDGATIEAATLLIRRSAREGTSNPYGWDGGIKIDVRRSVFGATAALHPEDFEAAADVTLTRRMSKPGADGEWSIVELDAAALARIHTSGRTQFRIYASDSTENPGVADYFGYNSGDASSGDRRPILVISHR